ncbi:unnamed protein product [Protopolystoma xenopodis]|uniref:Aminopeptidase N-like N-terminal domain-containing protein n=1 Tax=Protopolystoma xenopodis TaxID=117903 RepID=A0A3S5FG30_9PLAT|nr:unnamed protein product [Protopolystoma xenopodis]
MSEKGIFTRLPYSVKPIKYSIEFIPNIPKCIFNGLQTIDVQPANACRAFPCWDEPDRKAVFEVSLVVLDDLVALSNMRSTVDDLVFQGFTSNLDKFWRGIWHIR